MREVFNWWRDRTSQLLVLLTFAIVLAWQNLELRRADRYFRKAVAEIRESFRQQETARHVEFARLLNMMETRLSQMDRTISSSQQKTDQASAQPDDKSKSM